LLVYIRPCRQNARSKCNPKHRSPKKIVTQRKKNHNRNVIVFRKKIVTHNFKIIKKVFQFYLLPYYNAQKRFNDSQHPNLSLKNPKMLISRSQSASGMLDPLHTMVMPVTELDRSGSMLYPWPGDAWDDQGCPEQL
jgi:hypothetical protein